jgi:hypothetical protein
VLIVWHVLDLALLVHADHDGPLLRVQVEADDVADLGLQPRVGGELNVPSRQTAETDSGSRVSDAATSGRAVTWTPSPTLETAWASHSLVKSGPSPITTLPRRSNVRHCHHIVSALPG